MDVANRIWYKSVNNWFIDTSVCVGDGDRPERKVDKELT